jgi:hypothetical protein
MECAASADAPLQDDDREPVECAVEPNPPRELVDVWRGDGAEVRAAEEVDVRAADDEDLLGQIVRER